MAMLLLLTSAPAVVAEGPSSESPTPPTGSSAPVASAPPGGNLTVDLPAGAAPAGTTVGVVAQRSDERPDELKTVPSTLAFYEIQPTDVAFSGPATVTRTVAFGEVGIDHYDPLFDGLIVGSLFTRASDGTWSWLQDT